MEIRFNNVDYVYNINTPFEKIALLHINLEFKPGKINGIIGTGGSGKTTLIELINALKVPIKGNVKVDNFSVDNKRIITKINHLRRSIGLVFQYPEEQFFCKTVREELEFGLIHFRLKADKSIINQSLAMVGLDDSYLERNPFNLSSGEKRKVAIASILSFNPKVIILDEPTLGLDFQGKKELVKLLRSLKKDYKKTIIIVSNDTDLLLEISDYVFVIDKAKIVTEGTKYEVFNNPILKEIGIKIPKIIEFEQMILNKKKIKLRATDNINDLIKDVYRRGQ